jgi:O-antigen ligase
LPAPVGTSVLFLGVLYLCATSRWGSYLAPPGVSLYIGDAFVAAGIVQALVVVRARSSVRAVREALTTAPLFLLLTLTFLGWALLRAVLGVQDLAGQPLTALRDLAPYAYAVGALVAFVVPVADRLRTVRLVYAALTVHVLWVEGAGYLPGWPQDWPLLGGSAVFTSRPDFDTAVVGVAVALALHHLLHRRPRGPLPLAALALFAALNGYALLSSPTRAGLLAGLLASGVVVLGWLLRRTVSPRRLSGRIRAAGLVVLLALFVGLVALTPPGQRLAQSMSGQQSNAAGTINARELAWRAVDRYVLADAPRTAIGVGFGPDFLTDSGGTYLLEGDVYKDVRSPHNYLIGAFARLGVAGMLLAALLLAGAGLAAVRTLAGPVGTTTALAALLVLALPVTALLGVVLESPFGAIPYFWAVGQLARHTWSLSRRDHDERQASLASYQR